MASKMGLVMVVAAMMVGLATAQTNGCMSALVGLTPCLTYVTGNSSAPSSSCCTQLSGVVQANPQCLCMLVNGAGSNLGVNINQTLALALPAACKVQTPPVSQCNAANGPTSAAAVPASSPVGSQAPPSEPKGTPQVPNTPAGSKTVPSTTTGGSSSAADAREVSFRFLGFLVFAATLALGGFGI